MLLDTRPHTSTSKDARRRVARPPRAPARRPDPELLSDAVVASYIHEISERGRRLEHQSRP
jgi:hypothetical protein